MFNSIRGFSLAGLICLFSAFPASASVIIDITTDGGITSQPSFTFADYIFEMVDPSRQNFELIDSSLALGTEDFIVSNACCAGDFTLRRLDGVAFDLLSSNSQYERESLLLAWLDNPLPLLYKTLGTYNRISGVYELPLSTRIASIDLQPPGGGLSLNR